MSIWKRLADWWNWANDLGREPELRDELVAMEDLVRQLPTRLALVSIDARAKERAAIIELIEKLRDDVQVWEGMSTKFHDEFHAVVVLTKLIEMVKRRS